MDYQTIHTEVTYRGPAFDVRRDQIRLPNGNIAHLDIVDHVGAVVLLPLDSEGQVWFVRQYRHATNEMLLELPAGTLDEGEAPESCALREIREEIGMSAGRILKLGEFFLAPGYSTEFMYAFLATDLHPDPLQADDDEFLIIEKFPAAEVFELVENGRIRDCKTLAVLFLARPYLPG